MTKKWRPIGWPEDPCENCERKILDEYGYLCDISCGEHSSWLNFEAGANKMLDELRGLYSISVLSYLWISSAVKWAEDNKGRLVLIPDDKENE